MSYHGRIELLDGEIFYTLREAEIVIESWRRHYNIKDFSLIAAMRAFQIER